jgi:hypothetical protein
MKIILKYVKHEHKHEHEHEHELELEQKYQRRTNLETTTETKTGIETEDGMEWNGIEETEIREILDEEVMNRESNS